MIITIRILVFFSIAWAAGLRARGDRVAGLEIDDSARVEAVQQSGLSKSAPGLRTAVVNIQEVFRSYHKVERAEGEINLERARIQKEHNQAIFRLRALDQVLRELEGSLQELDREDMRRPVMEREKGIRLHERERLNRQSALDLKNKHADLNRRMVDRMQKLLGEIHDLVRGEAESMGFDLVFDVEGAGTSRVPFLLFAKDAQNITARIIRRLAESGPQDPEG